MELFEMSWILSEHIVLFSSAFLLIGEMQRMVTMVRYHQRVRCRDYLSTESMTATRGIAVLYRVFMGSKRYELHFPA